MIIKLKLSFLTYWHSGSGLGDGAGIDACVIKDKTGLPYYPGKGLRGLLRNAVEKAEALQWGPESETKLSTKMFGKSHLDNSANRITQQGGLRVSNAHLPDAERQFLSQPEQAAIVPGLYNVVSSTAIDETTGTALDKTLRTMEVTIPVDLVAELDFSNIDDAYRADCIALLSEAVTLIEHMGAKRSRGYGRVELQTEVANAG